MPAGEVIRAVNEVAFRHIETRDQAEQIFEFVQDDRRRNHLARAYRGARWEQKIGLILARSVSHDAHHAQVRTQLVEYGALAEAAIWTKLVQNGKDTLPGDFKGLIDKAVVAGILKGESKEAATSLREARNRVHLFLDTENKALVAKRDASVAYRNLTSVINACRVHSGLTVWRFGSAWPPAPLTQTES
jgi:hypothetical protein